MNSKDQFLQNVATLSKSGVGVMLARTSEPLRAQDHLKEWAFSNKLPLRSWNPVTGWTIENKDDDPDAAPTRIPMLDPFSALKQIRDIDGGGANAWDTGVCVVQAPQAWLGGNANQPAHPGLVELLRLYTWQISELNALRVVLVVPDTFSLPDEVQKDIPVVEYELPNSDEMSDVLDIVIESVTEEDADVPTPFNASQRETLIRSALGMTTLQAENAFSEAIVRNKKDWPNKLDFASFNLIVMAKKTEIVKQSDVLEIVSSIPIEDIAGLDQLKAWATITKGCFHHDFIEFGGDAPKGACLIGPPGTGKSVSMMALASLFGLPLLKLDIGRIFNSLVGASEQRARQALKMAEAMAPCLLFVDEVDKGLGGSHNGGGDSGVSQRVLQAILTFMSEGNKGVFVGFAANRADGLPPELLRKGRVDEVWAVMPPNEEERLQVLEIHLKKRKQDPTKMKDLALAVAESNGYVGAELEAAVKESVKIAYVDGVKVTGELIAQQLRMMKPISEAFKEDFDRMAKWAEDNARLASTPAKGDEDAQRIAGRQPARKQRRRRSVG